MTPPRFDAVQTGNTTSHLKVDLSQLYPIARTFPIGEESEQGRQFGGQSLYPMPLSAVCSDAVMSIKGPVAWCLS